jgi:single-stranded-DNA-specific exonuclease
MAAELDKANEERRRIEKQILEEATEEIEATLRADVRTIVLARRGWHPGVIGVVASRLQSTHNRPVALIALDEDGVGRGSARSADDFDMIAALGACRDHVVRFGGHAAAAGFTILEGNIRVFQTAFEAEAAKRLRTGETRLTIDVDALVSFTEIDAQLVKAIDRLEPFGCMNPSPVFCTYGVTPVPYSVRELRGGHARVRVQQGPRLFEAVGFHMAGLIQQMVGTGPIDIAYTPRLNTWRGETAIQLVLKDVHCA